MDKSYDKENMRKVLEEFPTQILEASKLGKNLKVEAKIDKIIIAGMGGSALPGEFLKSYIDIDIPIFINKDYTLPKHATGKSLVFIISYSGNTEETIQAYRDALKLKCKIIIICSGGKLKQLARDQKTPMILVPKDIQPRQAYGYLFFPILNILENSKIIEPQKTNIDKAVETLNKKELFIERAKDLAEKLHKKTPLIYSSSNMKAIAYKWKISFNENSKQHAFYNVFPELNHNEMVGYTKITENFHVILIHDEDDHPRIKKRMEIFKDLIKKRGIDTTEIKISGPNLMTRMFSAIYIGDWTSYFLALKNKVDPTPVDVVEEFKRLL